MTAPTFAGHTLAELRALLEAATPEPWEAGTAICCPDMGWVDGVGRRPCRVVPAEEGAKRTHTLDANDAALIAAARNALGPLLDTLEQALRDAVVVREGHWDEVIAERDRLAARLDCGQHRLDETEAAGCAACAWRRYHEERDRSEKLAAELAEARLAAMTAARLLELERAMSAPALALEDITLELEAFAVRSAPCVGCQQAATCCDEHSAELAALCDRQAACIEASRAARAKEGT